MHNHCIEGISTPPVESVNGDWNELILTLKGQYDTINLDTDAPIRYCLHFSAISKKEQFYHLNDGVEVYTFKMAIPTSNNIGWKSFLLAFPQE